FQETRPAAKNYASKANFWIVEGVATYFETLSEHRDQKAGLYYTIGTAADGRLPAARKHPPGSTDYVPLGQLPKWGDRELQAQPNLTKIYSEACGLSAFLMDGQEARYREPLVKYLVAVYAGHSDPQTLVKLTGSSYQELDAQYGEFLKSLP